MSVSKRRRKAAERAARAVRGDPTGKVAGLLRDAHKEKHPDCTYGDRPHFVPPSMGDIGFFMCDVPADIRNHTRCRPPYDHEHPLHRQIGESEFVESRAEHARRVARIDGAIEQALDAGVPLVTRESRPQDWTSPEADPLGDMRAAAERIRADAGRHTPRQPMGDQYRDSGSGA